jgi:outer membrane protein assembly factor BamB
MKPVEIIVGQSWKEDVRYLSDLRPYRPMDTAVNLFEIRDIIDIVIDGQNITANVAEEAIFPLVGELLEALCDLATGQSQKAIIEFHCEPWEMVLVPHGRHLLVSIYTIDRHYRVVADNLPIRADQFIEAVTGAAEAMLTDLFRICERFSADGVVRKLSSQLALLKRGRHTAFSTFSPTRSAQHGERIASTASTSGLTLSYSFDGNYSPLASYAGELVFDLHALLFGGGVEFELEGVTARLDGAYPYLTIIGIASRVREMLNHLESRSTSFVCDDPLAHGQVDIYGDAGLWRLVAHGVDEGRVEATLSPAECIDSLLTLCELFTKDLLSLNGRLELNQRFVDLDDEIRNLRSWYEDTCGKNLYLDRPEDYLRRQGHLEPRELTQPPAPTFGRPLDSVRALFPSARWRHSARHMRFERMVAAADRIVVPCDERLDGIDLHEGDVVWSHPVVATEDQPSRFAIAGDLVVQACQADGLSIRSLETGELVVRNPDLQRWQGMLEATHFPCESVVVIADMAGPIRAVSTATGALAWEHAAGHGRLAGVAASGPLITAQTTEGFIYTLNPLTGELLWKVRTGGHGEVAPRFHQGRLYTFTHDAHQRAVTIHAFYPFTGRTVWQLRIPGIVAGPPSFVDDWLMLPVERHGKVALEGIDVEAIHPGINWTVDLSSAGLYPTTPVVAANIDGELCGLIRTDRAETTCFRILDGRVRWQSMPASETLLLFGNLPLFVVADAVLAINETIDLRSLDTGALLHSFYPVDAPEFVLATGGLRILLGQQSTDPDADDTLTCLSVEHYLALV